MWSYIYLWWMFLGNKIAPEYSYRSYYLLEIYLVMIGPLNNLLLMEYFRKSFGFQIQLKIYMLMTFQYILMMNGWLIAMGFYALIVDKNIKENGMVTVWYTPAC